MKEFDLCVCPINMRSWISSGVDHIITVISFDDVASSNDERENSNDVYPYRDELELVRDENAIILLCALAFNKNICSLVLAARYSESGE